MHVLNVSKHESFARTNRRKATLTPAVPHNYQCVYSGGGGCDVVRLCIEKPFWPSSMGTD